MKKELTTKRLIIAILLICAIASCGKDDEANKFFSQTIDNLSVMELCFILVVIGLITRKN